VLVQHVVLLRRLNQQSSIVVDSFGPMLPAWKRRPGFYSYATPTCNVTYIRFTFTILSQTTH